MTLRQYVRMLLGHIPMYGTSTWYQQVAVISRRRQALIFDSPVILLEN